MHIVSLNSIFGLSKILMQSSKQNNMIYYVIFFDRILSLVCLLFIQLAILRLYKNNNRLINTN